MNKINLQMRSILLLFLATLCLSSCNIGINLTINPDNSGTYSLEIVYSDSVSQLMTDLGQDGSALEAETLSDETRAKIPEGITIHDLKETDSSAVLAFDFDNLEDLNGLFEAMQEGPDLLQKLELKGKKKYIYFFGPKTINKGEKETSPDIEMFKEVKFTVDLHFPKRTIYKVKNVDNYTIGEDNHHFNFSMPLIEFDQLKEPLEFELKVK